MMEQASLPLSATAHAHEEGPQIDAQPSRFARLRQDLKEVRATVSVITLCAATAIAGAFATTSQNPDRYPVSPVPAKVGEPNYAPITDLDPVGGDSEQVKTEFHKEYQAAGHTVSVAGPNTPRAFNSHFDDNPVWAKTPSLKEVINIQDRNVFKPELRAHPNKYPFEIYNTTEHPVDILFADFALRATRFWLKENARKPEGMDIGGHTLVKVKPRKVPHAMLMVGAMPDFLTDEKGWSGTNGFTTWEPNMTQTFISTAYGSPASPFSRQAIATETCQSLANVYDERPVPGEAMQEHSMQRFVAGFNAPARHNLDLASQESVCNMLGRVVAAVYQGGDEAVRKLPKPIDQTGLLPRTPWMDYSLAAAQVPHFLWLKNHIENREFNNVMIPKGDNSPTPRYYRHHQNILR